MDAFIAGILTPIVLWAIWRKVRPPAPKPRQEPQPRPPLLPGSWIPAKVSAVYGTVHTSDGRDFDTASPEAVIVDGPVVSFHLPVKERFKGTIVSHTIRLGALVTETKIQPFDVHREDRVTVNAPVEFKDLTYDGKGLPDWIRTQ